MVVRTSDYLTILGPSGSGKTSGNTIIVISHDSKVAALSKRVVSIFDGKIAV